MSVVRYRPITSCSYCPNRMTKSAEADIGYVPYCLQTVKELPYAVGSGLNGRIIALPTNVLPDWCPLPKQPEDVSISK